MLFRIPARAEIAVSMHHQFINAARVVETVHFPIIGRLENDLCIIYAAGDIPEIISVSGSLPRDRKRWFLLHVGPQQILNGDLIPGDVTGSCI